MNNLYFLRTEKKNEPFTSDEVKSLLSDDFKIQEIRLTPKGHVTDLTVVSNKHPELTGLDPISKGIGISLRENGGYWMDPRWFKDFEIFFSEVLPDLMTDLELEYDESMD